MRTVLWNDRQTTNKSVRLIFSSARLGPLLTNIGRVAHDFKETSPFFLVCMLERLRLKRA